MNDLHDLELLLRSNRPIRIKRNLRLALQTAEVVVPCILRLDEIEKGLAAGSEGDGLGQPIPASLATWMANRKAAVVLVATSNDITRLPPELVREGRLDEICFVNLPHQSLRREGFAIHLPRRDRRNPAPVGSHGPPDELRAWTRGRKVPAHRSGSVSTLDPGGD